MSEVIIIEVAEQGPPGPSGSGTTDIEALHTSQRLAEFSTPTAKTQARTNLELEDIDCGTFN